MMAMLAVCLAAETTMRDFDFLTGRWTAADGSYEELWLAPTENAMQGTARRLEGGRTAFMEFFSIEKGTDGKFALHILLGSASRGPKQPKRFELVRTGKGEAVFEMPSNDFPKTIHYKTEGSSGLSATLTGVMDGKETKEVIRLLRAKA